VVTLPDGRGGRRDVQQGEFGSPASRAEYDRVIAEWMANQRRLSAAPTGPRLTVDELLVAYWEHVEADYRHADGTPTSEVHNIKLALRPLRSLYGHTSVADFDSLALEAVRDQMIRGGHARGRVNKDIDRIKRVFKWGVARRLVPASVLQLLQAVEGLRSGRSAAKETEPVRPVAEAVVEETLPHVSDQVAAMARLQLLTGMRPGEAVVMRGLDLDTSAPVWFYRPGSDRGRYGAHKNAYRGQDRVIAIGPRAQEVLRPWLRLNLQEYLFQPREARGAFNAKRRARRVCKVYPCERKKKPKRRPKKAPGEQYTTVSYAHAIADGCLKAHASKCVGCKRAEKEPHKDWATRARTCPGLAAFAWHPNQLRHTKATEIRREAGIDAARAVLGHRSPKVTETYAELDKGKAAEVMGRLG